MSSVFVSRFSLAALSRFDQRLTALVLGISIMLVGISILIRGQKAKARHYHTRGVGLIGGGTVLFGAIAVALGLIGVGECRTCKNQGTGLIPWLVVVAMVCIGNLWIIWRKR